MKPRYGKLFSTALGDEETRGPGIRNAMTAKHHFAVEYRPAGVPASISESARWFRCLKEHNLRPGNARGRRKLRRAKQRFKDALTKSTAFVAPATTHDSFFIYFPSGGFPELPAAVQALDRKPWPMVELKPDIEVGPAWDEIHESELCREPYRQVMGAPPIQSAASDTVVHVLSRQSTIDYVETAAELEAVARRHGVSDADVQTIRDRFFAAYPQLRALAEMVKKEMR